MVNQSPSFVSVGNEFILYYLQRLKQYKEENPEMSVDCLVFVAHNGRAFNVPYLFKAMKSHNIKWPDAFDKEVIYWICLN